MTPFNIAKNLTQLRREKQVTQEALAAHIGVTKGAVSKWENGTSMPDILMLPLLAAYFDVSIDALLGYEPQLSADKIKAAYKQLARDFSEKPFEAVMNEIRALSKAYYACYPLLYQLCVLLLNHYNLAADRAAQLAVLEEMDEWLNRIQSHAEDKLLCQDAQILQSCIWLQRGRAKQAIEVLESIGDPLHLSSQSGALLVSAYLQDGDAAQADARAQLEIYLSLINLITQAGSLLLIQAADPPRFATTLARIDAVIEAFDLVNLHPNAVGQFCYQAASIALNQGNEGEALRQLRRFVRCVEALFSGDGPRLHGDAYFDRLDEWIARLEQRDSTPRDPATVKQELLAQFDQPFAALADKAEFIHLRAQLKAVIQ